MFYILSVLLIGVAGIGECKKLHEYMTPEEVMAVFHTSHEKVPDYEVVPVRHTLNKRSAQATHHVHVATNGLGINLYLNPTEGVFVNEDTPVLAVSTDPREPEGLRYTLLQNALRTAGKPYQDIRNGAAILIRTLGPREVLMDGIVSPNMVLRSIPKRLTHVAYNTNGGLEFTNYTANDGLESTYHHVVYKRSESKQGQDFKFTNPEYFYQSSRQQQQVPSIIYPQILVVADYHEYALLGRNVEQAIRYLLSFWNAVDLRYRLLTTPKIRINIAGFVIAVDADAIPYIQRTKDEQADVDADHALKAMADYFYRETRLSKDSYDMAVAMTPLDLCNMVEEYNWCDTATLGYAYVAGACNRNHTKKTSEAVGIIEDNGGFSGIIPGAHEVAHLIGARHDGSPKAPMYCPPEDGYIMASGLMLHENGFQWSNCSIASFYSFLTEERSQCLHNKPQNGVPVARYLPGQLMNVDRQCQKVYGTRACNRDASVCTRLECVVPSSGGICKAIAPAAEGSRCGDRKVCLNGKCVSEIIRTVYTAMEGPVPRLALQRIRPFW